MMFKSISDVISNAIAPLLAGREIDASLAAQDGVSQLSPADGEMLKIAELSRRIVAASKKMSKSAEDAIGQTRMDLFEGLPVAVPVDINGKKIKPLLTMTREEAEWIIKIRDKQIIDDTKSVRAMRRLYMRALPFWEQTPDMLWGDCLLAANGASNDNIEAAVAA